MSQHNEPMKKGSRRWSVAFGLDFGVRLANCGPRANWFKRRNLRHHLTKKHIFILEIILLLENVLVSKATSNTDIFRSPSRLIPSRSFVHLLAHSIYRVWVHLNLCYVIPETPRHASPTIIHPKRHFNTWTPFTVILATNFPEQKPIEEWQLPAIVQDGSKLLHHQHLPTTRLTWQVSRTNSYHMAVKLQQEHRFLGSFPVSGPLLFVTILASPQSKCLRLLWPYARQYSHGCLWWCKCGTI